MTPFLLKHMHNLSDQALCARWVETAFQFFCGEVAFPHELPFDRSLPSRWRKRLSKEQLAALLHEILAVAHRSRALQIKDPERVVVATTVQEKAIAHPTDAWLSHRAIEKLVDPAKREGVSLRARAICVWPSAPRSWSGATPTPISQARPARA